ncbi:MAG: hypothetical protein A2580_15270 [Hydrogenophilales bacterium RIFOXYD1_FULL_62_11]|nr:MAG: hypothetical protein A2580_15270 [Hydrogenophilales bacterium RIFOXYD1_FULL_62_11]
MAAEGINSDADGILRSMSNYLAGTKAFSVSADISNEVMTTTGQKLQLNSHSDVLMERPSRFHATRHGKFADAELFYDGAMLTLYGKTLNAYVQEDLKGSTDDAIRVLELGTGLGLPGADLLLSDPYTALTSGVTSSGYYGKAYVGGVETHHLAFRTPKVDWQIWVKAGDEPLPMKYVITTKWMTGAPQYSVQLSNWNTKPVIASSRFKFVAPKGADKLEALPVDETGEITDKQESK